jgi:hypothetical protein
MGGRVSGRAGSLTAPLPVPVLDAIATSRYDPCRLMAGARRPFGSDGRLGLPRVPLCCWHERGALPLQGASSGVGGMLGSSPVLEAMVSAGASVTICSDTRAA